MRGNTRDWRNRQRGLQLKLHHPSKFAPIKSSLNPTMSQGRNLRGDQQRGPVDVGPVMLRDL